MEFKSHEKLKTIYWLYTLPYIIPMAVICAIVSWFHVLVGAVLAVLTIGIPVIILAIWIPRFYSSITFRLEEDHAYARYGVWWRKEKRVPYSLVSEVRIRQGPLQRKLGLANVDVFTPATGTVRPEMTFFQLEKDMAWKIASMLREKAGILSAEKRKAVEEEILEELKKIRRLLEEKLGAG